MGERLDASASACITQLDWAAQAGGGRFQIQQRQSRDRGDGQDAKRFDMEKISENNENKGTSKKRPKIVVWGKRKSESCQQKGLVGIGKEENCRALMSRDSK